MSRLLPKKYGNPSSTICVPIKLFWVYAIGFRVDLQLDCDFDNFQTQNFKRITKLFNSFKTNIVKPNKTTIHEHNSKTPHPETHFREIFPDFPTSATIVVNNLASFAKITSCCDIGASLIKTDTIGR